MTSHVYTLNELVDLALRTPSVGAVNFNILRIILQKIISECKLQNVTAEWKPFEATPVTDILEDEELPDHPILRRIEGKKAKDTGPDEVSIKPAKSATPSEEKAVQTPESLSQTEAEDTGDESTDATESKTETETSGTFSNFSYLQCPITYSRG